MDPSDFRKIYLRENVNIDEALDQHFLGPRGYERRENHFKEVYFIRPFTRPSSYLGESKLEAVFMGNPFPDEAEEHDLAYLLFENQEELDQFHLQRNRLLSTPQFKSQYKYTGDLWGSWGAGIGSVAGMMLGLIVGSIYPTEVQPFMAVTGGIVGGTAAGGALGAVLGRKRREKVKAEREGWIEIRNKKHDTLYEKFETRYRSRTLFDEVAFDMAIRTL
ncbi:MAG: hypothetical protein AABX04_00565 [Nanoarchaeota archaeon]